MSTNNLADDQQRPDPSLAFNVFLAGAVSGIFGGSLLTVHATGSSATVTEQLNTAALFIPLGTMVGLFAGLAVILLATFLHRAP